MADTGRPWDLASARRRSVAVCLTVFLGFAAVALLRLVDLGASPAALAGGAVLVAGMLAVQVTVVHRPVPTRSRAVLVLLVQACLSFVPLALLGEAWIGMPGFLAGTLLLYCGPLRGWTGFGAVVLAAGVVEGSTFQSSPAAVAYVIVSTGITGLVSWGLTRLAHALRQVDDAHRELADNAAVEERLRMARDVHDILGSGLSAIILKTELAHRLLHRDVGAADVELTETLGIARRSLADVRSVADGFADLTLHDELRLARSVLEGAGVAATIDGPVAEVGSQIDLSAEASSTIGTAIREAVTNAMRHAQPGRCRITVDADAERIRLTIVNDGVGDDGPADGRVGQGLRNLRARFTALGGDFDAGREGRDGFVVRAHLPRCAGRITGDDTLTAADVATAAPRATEDAHRS